MYRLRVPHPSFLRSFYRYLLLCSLLLVSLGPGATPVWAGELAVTFFDIGQGDAALVVSPTGKRVLIDGGPPEGTPALLDGLAKRKIDRLDLIILSHPHLDHLGGLRKVVEKLPVAMYMDSGYESTSPPYNYLLKALATRGVQVVKATLGRNIDIGDGANLRLLAPPSPWLVNTRSDVNANSVIVRLSWRGRSVLFSGDAEPEAEQWLLNQYRNEPAALQAEVLKVPHHGGRFSSTAPFLAAVQPRLAVISVAAVNDYHHPTPEAMARLQKVGAQLFRTDQGGAITLRSRDGQPWKVESERPLPSATTAPASPAQAQLPAPTPTPTPTPAPAPAAGFVGSSRTQVFHRADCPAGKQIVAANQVHWATRDEAIASGRRPAEDCQP